MFFPYHLVGPAEVEEFMRGWVDTLAAATVPDGAPDFADLPGDLLRVGPFDVLWAPGTLFTGQRAEEVVGATGIEPVTSPV